MVQSIESGETESIPGGVGQEWHWGGDAIYQYIYQPTPSVSATVQTTIMILSKKEWGPVLSECLVMCTSLCLGCLFPLCRCVPTAAPALPNCYPNPALSHYLHAEPRVGEAETSLADSGLSGGSGGWSAGRIRPQRAQAPLDEVKRDAKKKINAKTYWGDFRGDATMCQRRPCIHVLQRPSNTSKLLSFPGSV